MRRALLSTVVGIAIVAPLVGAGATYAAPAPTTPPELSRCPQLSEDLDWYGDNRERLQRVIDEYGTCTNPHAEDRPVAAFDWDNTLTKNDVTDATLAWALRNDKILRPASWKDTSAWLTDEAHRALTEACGTEVPVGKPLPTSRNAACADEILQIRQEATTMAGEEAFAGEWNHRRTVPEYAWVPQLFAGHTPDQLTSYARKARAQALVAPVGSTQTVGTHELPRYVRYYDQMRDLVDTLTKAGFESYVVSAGSEPITEAWAPGIGIDREHTIAIRSVLQDGKITTRTEGCGGEPDSQGADIPYKDGKRCWINQEIFGIDGPEAWQRQSPENRIVIGGGDADTDVTFVDDAVGAHIVINRNDDEIMCRGYDNADGRWIINPMFIEPLERRSELYPCSTTGATEPDGSKAPVRREDGSIIPDQEDTIHG